MVLSSLHRGIEGVNDVRRFSVAPAERTRIAPRFALPESSFEKIIAEKKRGLIRNNNRSNIEAAIHLIYLFPDQELEIINFFGIDRDALAEHFKRSRSGDPKTSILVSMELWAAYKMLAPDTVDYQTLIVMDPQEIYKEIIERWSGNGPLNSAQQDNRIRLLADFRIMYPDFSIVDRMYWQKLIQARLKQTAQRSSGYHNYAKIAASERIIFPEYGRHISEDFFHQLVLYGQDGFYNSIDGYLDFMYNLTIIDADQVNIQHGLHLDYYPIGSLGQDPEQAQPMHLEI